jgi:hypothetical protein
LKLESQLHENKVHRKLEVVAALETGKEEGYACGCKERLEVTRRVLVEVARMNTSRQMSVTPTNVNPSVGPASVPPNVPSIHGLRNVSVLHSGLRNPWGSLSQQHHHSHRFNPPPWVPCHPLHYVTNKCTINPPASSSPLIQVMEVVRHPHKIGETKPVLREPVPIPVIASPAHLMSLIRITSSPVTAVQHYQLSQSQYITSLCHTLSLFIPSVISYSLSISSHVFSGLLFG